LWALKGLIGLKKCLTFFILVVEKPVFWLWKAIFHPLVTLIYRFYRFFKKLLEVHLLDNGRLVNLFTRRYVINIAILLITFLVTATNIHASSGDSVREDVSGQTSLLARLTSEMEEELLVEEADTDVDADPDLSYLDGQALNVQDYYAGGTNSADLSDSEDLVEADEDGELPPIFNAVRGQSESASQEERPPTRTSIVEYVVQEGDTVDSIARQFGLQAATLLQSNGLAARGLIRPGQKLRILPVDGVLYTIRKGDNLSKIAKTYKSDESQIVDINALADELNLEVGRDIILPGGRLPPPPPAPKPSSYASNYQDKYVPPTAFDGMSAGSLLWPTESRRITQYFTRRHYGLDVGGPLRTPIYAATDGTVIYSGWNRGGYGNMVIIDHGGGLFTRYGHATKLLVKAGDTVKRGDTIALMGSTGRSTGSHLHFEVLKGDIHHRINPLDFVK